MKKSITMTEWKIENLRICKNCKFFEEREEYCDRLKTYNIPTYWNFSCPYFKGFDKCLTEAQMDKLFNKETINWQIDKI